MTPLVVHVFDLWLSFHSLHYTVSPIKMTMTLCCNLRPYWKRCQASFMFFMKGFWDSSTISTSQTDLLTNVTMKSSYQRKNIMLSKRMHGLSCHSSSCNIWLLSYFIDLQIVCICLVCHHSYLYDSSIYRYLFFLIAFVADVMKKELMFTHTCTWSSV